MSELRVAARAPSFFDLYSRGEVAPDDMDDFVGRWHADLEPWARDMKLHEYLGLIHEEYKVLLCDPLALPSILQARQPGANLAAVMAQRYEELRTANHPADRAIIYSLGHWLKTQSQH